MNNDNPLKGKNALITGAALRLGRELALALARQGVNIIVHYNTSLKDAEKVRKEIKKTGVKSWPLQADFTNPAACDKLMTDAAGLVKKIDILINSASIFPSGSLNSIDLEDLANNMQINAWAPFLLSRSFARAEEAGQIVNFLDTRIRSYDRNHAAYHLSKKTLETLTRLMALEYAPRITVNAVAPGLILPPKGQGKEYLENLKGTNPLQTYGDPRDITDAVLFLLKSSFITGQVLFVDGGRHLKGAGGG